MSACKERRHLFEQRDFCWLVRLKDMLRILLSLFLGSFVLAEGPIAPTAEQLPGHGTLFNGWKLSPAGAHAALPGDMPLKMIVSPDGKTAVTVCAGYNNPGVAVLDIATQKQTQSIPLQHAWNGLAFDHEGRRLFASGGASGEIHVFHYENGKLDAMPSVAIGRAGEPIFVAGIAVHPETG